MRLSKRTHSMIRSAPLLLLIASMIAACGGTSNGVSVGDEAPAFTLPTASGGEVALADYAGKQPVLLYFHMALG